jgi:hypothetical protein
MDRRSKHGTARAALQPAASPGFSLAWQATMADGFRHLRAQDAPAGAGFALAYRSARASQGGDLEVAEQRI